MFGQSKTKEKGIESHAKRFSGQARGSRGGNIGKWCICLTLKVTLL